MKPLAGVFMTDYEKPILNKNKKPLTILETAAHHCIRCRKKAKDLSKLGYTLHGMGDMMSYGTEEYDTYTTWKNEKQFKNAIRMYVNQGVDIIEWNNEPDHPVQWIREVLADMNAESRVKLIVDCHDLDSIRKDIIPIPERIMFNSADGIIYVSQPIQKITNALHLISKPNIVLYSYCNKGIVEYDEEKISERKGLVYQGGANPPQDYELNRQFSYRSLYGIMKKLVEMGNETHMYCGNLSAFDTYHGTGAFLQPPTEYNKMMSGLVNYKYGILIFNNEDGAKNQVNYTMSNKQYEYNQAGLPLLSCWCPEMMKYVAKHKIGFTFNHIEEIGNCQQLESKYMEVMENIKLKRKELVMENFIWKLENLYAEVLGLKKKAIPEKIKKLSLFEYDEENMSHLLTN
jgi:hypothetical protein